MTGSVLEICSEIMNARPKMKLYFLQDRSESTIRKVKNLNRVFEGFRTILGDGNCYYRAVMFGLVEQIIKCTEIGRASCRERVFRAV